MSSETWTPYQYNTNTDLDWEINRYLTNNETFTTKIEKKKYQINKKERLILEKILNKNNLEDIATKTSRKNLLKLKSEIIVSSATVTIRKYINDILNLQDKKTSHNNQETYLKNSNSNLVNKIKEYLNNSKSFKQYSINKAERIELEKLINSMTFWEITEEIPNELLIKLSKEIHPSQALKKKIDNAIYNNLPSESIENANISINKYFNKSQKWKILKWLIEKHSSISIDKMNNYVNNASKQFDVPVKFIMAIIIWESDVWKKKNPFKVNSKWIWQFISKTFPALYSKVKWIWKRWITEWKNRRRTSQWDVLAYFNRTHNTKYAQNLKNIWLSKLSNRYNPEKSILAIGAYLKYISIVKNLNFSQSLAKYNTGPFTAVTWSAHFKTNPAIKREFDIMFGKNAKKTSDRVYSAAENYYNNFV